MRTRLPAFILIYMLSLLFASGIHGQIPTSRRARKAIKRCSPALKKELKAEGLSKGAPVFMRIVKADSMLEVFLQNGEQFELFKTYKICSYSGGLGPKKQQGDGKSPEGFYYVTPGQLNPYSNFHLSFNIGYPNTYDRLHGYTGNYLMVHGNCVSIGCYAMTDSNIEEIYTLIYWAFQAGQPFFRIHIFPFSMSEGIPFQYLESPHYEFWQNLQAGWYFFETHHYPPDVYVKAKEYAFRHP